MRVLVVGTVPPPGGAAAARLGAVAAGLAADGHHVEVLSPDERSAAHHHAHLSGILLAVELARRARHFDALVLAIAPGLPLGADVDRAARALTLAALGAACRGFGEVTIRCASPIPIPGGVGGRASSGLWARAASIVVECEEDREQLLAVPGCAPERVHVEPVVSVVSVAEAHDRSWPSTTDDDLRDRIQALVRDRAARSRSVDLAGRSLAAGATDDAGDPFAGPMPRSTVPRAADLARVVAARLGRELRARVASARAGSS
ncbi:MAG: hypothetical protein ACYCTE_11200 [Acidimicrobiales bacterium]